MCLFQAVMLFPNTLLHPRPYVIFCVTILWLSKSHNWFINYIRAIRASHNQGAGKHSVSDTPLCVQTVQEGIKRVKRKSLNWFSIPTLSGLKNEMLSFPHHKNHIIILKFRQDSTIILWVDIMRFCWGRCRIWTLLIPLEPERFHLSAEA